MCWNRLYGLSRNCIPELNGVVGPSRTERASVWADSQAQNGFFMRIKGIEHGTVIRIPDLYALIRASGENLLAVGRDGDTCNGRIMGKYVLRLLSVAVPDTNRIVGSAGNNPREFPLFRG